MDTYEDHGQTARGYDVGLWWRGLIEAQASLCPSPPNRLNVTPSRGGWCLGVVGHREDLELGRGGLVVAAAPVGATGPLDQAGPAADGGPPAQETRQTYARGVRGVDAGGDKGCVDVRMYVPVLLSVCRNVRDFAVAGDD